VLRSVALVVLEVIPARGDDVVRHMWRNSANTYCSQGSSSICTFPFCVTKLVVQMAAHTMNAGRNIPEKLAATFRKKTTPCSNRRITNIDSTKVDE
jgi:hypothetical protein